MRVFFTLFCLLLIISSITSQDKVRLIRNSWVDDFLNFFSFEEKSKNIETLKTTIEPCIEIIENMCLGEEEDEDDYDVYERRSILKSARNCPSTHRIGRNERCRKILGNL
ncbi:hypothetical protein PVAND_013930 [Polypedilum vanderplanki]|uniref:Venom protein n=1 Tax=Polypedilum vanderplanki TaxID=319348 RepID=A0A9J6CS44_POLVA|nr:hypothetical protein PVAND_013930 [Polypedilum vanderplanki]